MIFSFLWLTSPSLIPDVFTVSKSSWSSSKDACLTRVLQEKELSDGYADICARKKPLPSLPMVLLFSFEHFHEWIVMKMHLEGTKEGSRPVAEEWDPLCFSWACRGWVWDYSWKLLFTEGTKGCVKVKRRLVGCKDLNSEDFFTSAELYTFYSCWL